MMIIAIFGWSVTAHYLQPLFQYYHVMKMVAEEDILYSDALLRECIEG